MRARATEDDPGTRFAGQPRLDWENSKTAWITVPELVAMVSGGPWRSAAASPTAPRTSVTAAATAMKLRRPRV